MAGGAGAEGSDVDGSDEEFDDYDLISDAVAAALEPTMNSLTAVLQQLAASLHANPHAPVAAAANVPPPAAGAVHPSANSAAVASVAAAAAAVAASPAVVAPAS